MIKYWEMGPRLAAWSVIGWLLMLRSPTSTARGLALARPLYARCERLSESIDKFFTPKTWNGYPAAVVLLLYVSAMVLGSLVVKLLATVRTLVTHPLETLLSIPRNWSIAVFCVDSAVSPELIPGIHQTLPTPAIRTEWTEDGDDYYYTKPNTHDVRYETLAEEFKRVHVDDYILFPFLVLLPHAILAWIAYHLIAGIHLATSSFGGLLIATIRLIAGLALFGPVLSALVYSLVRTPLRLVLFIPAFLYRAVIKATAIVYFPLFLVIWYAATEDSADEQLLAIRHGVVSAFRSICAIGFIAFIALKILVGSSVIRLHQLLQDLGMPSVLTHFLAPYSIPGWQVASLVNSVIAIGTIIASDRWLRRAQHGHPIPRDAIVRSIRIITLISGTLGLYSLGCCIYIVAHNQPFLRLPLLGPLFPWR